MNGAMKAFVFGACLVCGGDLGHDNPFDQREGLCWVCRRIRNTVQKEAAAVPPEETEVVVPR